MKKVVEFSEENTILCLATVSRNQKAKRRPFMCAVETEALVRQKNIRKIPILKTAFLRSLNCLFIF